MKKQNRVKSKLLIAGVAGVAGVLVSASPAMAATTLPAICNTTINYAVQAFVLPFTDATSPAGSDNANSVTLNKDFKDFPISNVELVDDCQGETVPPACEVAGGSPVVYQAEVAQGNGSEYFPLATVTVTYNRGGCRVDSIVKK